MLNIKIIDIYYLEFMNKSEVIKIKNMSEHSYICVAIGKIEQTKIVYTDKE